MKYCKKCVIPDTRPGIKFDSEGICHACRVAEKKNTIDWDKRMKELQYLCKKYRGSRGNGHDCIVTVSGGKDSYYQVYVMKELMEMNPLLIKVEDNFPETNAGKHNLRNLSEEFGCEIMTLKPNLRAQRQLTRKTFELYGMPTWYIDRLIYTYPIHIAINFQIPLVVYGENTAYEYGNSDEETYSAKEQINNKVAPEFNWNVLIGDKVSKKDLSFCEYPSSLDIEKARIEPIFLSYFVRWSDYGNYVFAKSRGFQDLFHEWRREHMFDDYGQIDSTAYLVHPWMKYPKFGHGSTTDHICRAIRDGIVSREKAIEYVKEHDHNLDQKALKDFLDFAGYSAKEFWDIVEKFWNKELFEKNQFGQWKLKKEIE